MDAVLDILLRGMDIIERLRSMTSVTGIQMIFFGVLLVFGIINCVLGYRLLRFWMMLFGFILGAGLGFGASFLMGIGDNATRIAVSIGVGILLAVIVFISYKAGIFVLGAGLGLGIAVYVLHPTSSLVFFFCLLAGVGLGSLAMKWAREVIIVGTSLLGGAMAGMSLAKLGGLGDFPYGIGLSAAFAALGMLIQFASNRVRYEEDEEYEKPSQRKKRKTHKEEKKYDPYIEDEGFYETPVGRKKTADREAAVRSSRPEVNAHTGSKTRTRRNHIPVDVQVGKDKRHIQDYPIESEKTIVYRPRRRPEPDLDLPLDSYAYDDSYGKRPYPKNSSKKKTYTIRVDREENQERQMPYEEENFRSREFYADLNEDKEYGNPYEEPIDEEELDEEILREIMEEEDRESILPWKKHGDRKSRKEGHNGKRS